MRLILGLTTLGNEVLHFGFRQNGKWANPAKSDQTLRMRTRPQPFSPPLLVNHALPCHARPLERLHVHSLRVRLRDFVVFASQPTDRPAPPTWRIFLRSFVMAVVTYTHTRACRDNDDNRQTNEPTTDNEQQRAVSHSVSHSVPSQRRSKKFDVLCLKNAVSKKRWRGKFDADECNTGCM